MINMFRSKVEKIIGAYQRRDLGHRGPRQDTGLSRTDKNKKIELICLLKTMSFSRNESLFFATTEKINNVI